MARDRFQQAAQAESKVREKALDDLKFSVGEQWPLDIQADRQVAGRPCLTINVLPQFIKQITNEQRQQRPSITVNPVGSNSDVDTADILQGIIRHIEVQCDAEVAYDYAFEYMVRIGFGYWRLDTQIGPDGGQEIIVSLVRNPFCIYNDPNAQKLDRSDARYQFSMVDLPESEFKEKYKQSKLAKGEAAFTDYASIGDSTPGWASNSGPLPTIRVCEYWYFDEGKKEMSWALITGLDILDEEETIWECPPNVGVFGEDLVVDGQVSQAGLVRAAKSAQQAKNYWTSATTEAVALAPKAPWVGTKDQIGPYEAMYKQSNTRNLAVLYYNPHAVAGGLVPPPQRQSAEPPIQAMTALLNIADQDLQATTGIYPAGLGKEQAANESGKAVLARQKQGQVTNLNFSDNLARSTRHSGRMIVKSIKKVYTEAKIQRIIKPDETAKQVGIFNSKNDDQAASLEKLSKLDDSIKKVFDVGTGTYDVTVSVGPSYQTKRQEASATQLALIQAEPQLLTVIGDMAVGNMDIPQAQEMAKRMKAILSPAVQAMLGDDPEAQQQQIIAQHGQLVQHVQQLTQQLQQAMQTIATKKVETDGKVAIEQHKSQTQMSIEQMKIEAQIAIAEINTKAQNAIQRAQIYNDIFAELHGSAHELALQQQAQQAAQQQAQQEGQQAQQAQQSNQTHELGMAAATQAAQPQNGAGGE